MQPTRLHASRALHPLMAAILLAALFAAGCGGTPIGVRRLGRERVFRRMTANVLSASEPSDFSLQVLDGNDLLALYKRSPDKALAQLDSRSRQEFDRANVFALAELSLLWAQESEDKSYFLAAAIYAYRYALGEESLPPRDPFDPRFRIAADIYNCALTEFLKSDKGEIVFQSGTYELPFGGSIEIEVKRDRFPWEEHEFHIFLPALEFVPRGLSPRIRFPGMGAPLIAARTTQEKPEPGEGPVSDYVAPKAKVPATVFLRIHPGEIRNERPRLKGSLELYYPLYAKEIEVEGHKIPLEADLTSPLAFALEERSIWNLELSGLLSGGTAGFRSGLYFMRPYTPGKIPVVFVHGTASSPARWAPLVNGLQAYENVRDRYQFWYFLYSTGSPILYSAHLLREGLQEAVKSIDPEGKDPALRQMVIIGHSQGGLLTKLMAIHSQNAFWDYIRTEKFGGAEIPADRVDLVRRALIVEPLPFVKRVVFVCAPHHGSFLSAWWPSRILISLMQSPKAVTEVVRDIRRNQDEKAIKKVVSEENIQTSIEQMHPDNKILNLLLGMAIDPAIKANSIIAVEGDGPLEEGDDGVVAYKSAHLDGTESEFTVRWGHSCQSHPLVIQEIRRVLQEHLKASAVTQAAPAEVPEPPVVPPDTRP